MLTLQNISFIHPNKDLLFDNFGLIVNRRDKIALIAKNGSGKSTLQKIIAGNLQASSGILNLHAKPYYIPKIFGQYKHLSIAEALLI